jgi:excisionase family DNA binding protein
MGSDLLTSTDVARLLGVTAATVKRWADDGLLACERTAGRHRRFTAAAVERFRTDRGRDGAAPARLVDRLLEEADVIRIQAELLEARARLGAWWRVAEGLAPELEELGRRWEQGRIGIVEEHLASERLARALARAAESLPARPSAPRALLAVAEGEEHLLGLALVDLCMREEGWNTRWSGRCTPAADLVAQVERHAVEAVVLSASLASPPGPLAAEAGLLAEPCRRRGVQLIVGGSGPWPDPPPAGRLERTFAGLRRWMAEVERGTARA